MGLTAGLLRFNATNGRVVVTTQPPQGSAAGGLPIRNNGDLCVSMGAPVFYHSGIGFAGNGGISVATVGTPAFYNQGFPFTANGRMLIEPLGGGGLPPGGYLAALPRSQGHGGVCVVMV